MTRLAEQLSTVPLPNPLPELWSFLRKPIPTISTASWNRRPAPRMEHSFFVRCPRTLTIWWWMETASGLGMTTTYNATVTLKVGTGSAMGNIPLVPEPTTAGLTTTPSSPATLQGQITTTTASAGGSPTSADVNLSALQSVVVPGTGTPM